MQDTREVYSSSGFLYTKEDTQMKKMIIAVAVIALAAAMCIPACIFADNSDAVTKTNGSSGISVKISTSDATEIAKFYSTEDWNDIATGVWNGYFGELIGYLPNYNISEGKVVEMDFKESHGVDITDDYVSNVNSESTVTKYTFKATTVANDYAFFENNLGQLIKYVEPTNKTHKDAVLNVTVTVEDTTSTVTKNYITKNSENNYVVTKRNSEILNYEKVSAEIKYTYGTIEKSFTYEKTNDLYSDTTVNVDFMDVEPKDATATTNVIKSTDYNKERFVLKTVVKCDGKTYTNETDEGATLIKHELSTFGTLGAGMVISADISAPVYKFYGDVLDPYAIFNEGMVADTSLRSNDAMKTYLDDNGSIGETFSSAESTADSMMPSSGGGTNILLFVAIGIGAVVIVAIVVFVFLKKK